MSLEFNAHVSEKFVEAVNKSFGLKLVNNAPVFKYIKTKEDIKTIFFFPERGYNDWMCVTGKGLLILQQITFDSFVQKLDMHYDPHPLKDAWAAECEAACKAMNKLSRSIADQVCQKAAHDDAFTNAFGKDWANELMDIRNDILNAKFTINKHTSEISGESAYYGCCIDGELLLDPMWVERFWEHPQVNMKVLPVNDQVWDYYLGTNVEGGEPGSFDFSDFS